MGCPLALVVAKLFMVHHERTWLKLYEGPGINFYRKYVGDSFCLFNNSDAVAFFKYIYSQHRNIKFKMEKEVNQKLSFSIRCTHRQQ